MKKIKQIKELFEAGKEKQAKDKRKLRLYVCTGRGVFKII